MEFTRVKKRGQTQTTTKTWMDPERRYRITWRNEVCGVSIEPAYQACVLCVRSNTQRDQTYWDFAGPRRPFKTMKAAVAACDANEKVWNAFIELGHEPGRRVTKLHALMDRAKVGTKPLVNPMLSAIPKWALKDADAGLLRIMFAPVKGFSDEDDECNDPAPSDSTEPASLTPMEPSSSSPSTPASGPASSAEGKAPSQTRRQSVSTKQGRTKSNAQRAKARGAAAKRK